jgi:glycosyltransferase involved in cell wall biosynthesis
MPPLVSINLCCYNSERYLEETLESVFAQTFQDWQLVIIDDGSSDSTATIIRKHACQRDNITVRSQANAGLAVSRNRALELSTGKYTALIDHDDVWMPDKLEHQVRQLESDDHLGLSYTSALVIDGEGRILRPYIRREVIAEGEVWKQLFLGDFIACSSVLIRREAIDRVGAFRPELRITEEYDLFLRIAEKYAIGRIDLPLVKLRMHSANASWNFLRTRAENNIVLGECLRRQPGLEREMGRAIVRIRLAGFSCTSKEAAFLRAPFQVLWRVATRRIQCSPLDIARAIAKLVAASLPRVMLHQVLTTIAARRRRAAM